MSFRLDSDHHDDAHELSDELVSSWAFSVTQQVLDQVSSRPLDAVPSLEAISLRDAPTSRPSQLIAKRGQYFLLKTPPYTIQTPRFMTPPEQDRRQDDVPQGLIEPTKGKEMNQAHRPGLGDLAAYRAELISFQRRILTDLALTRGWRLGWDALKHSTQGSMHDVDLDQQDAPPTDGSREDLSLQSVPGCFLASRHVISRSL